MSCCVLVSGATLDSEASLVSISTLPTNGPFYVWQTVQFICEASTTMNVSYQWNYVGNIYNTNFRTGQIIYVTFDQSDIRYIWVLCTASSSGVTIGKANKMVEVHGKS